MNTLERWILVVALLLLTAAATQSANKPGLQAEGTLIPGNLVIVGTTSNDLKDGGPPGQAKGITIGDTVGNSLPNKCLTVDGQGRLAQIDCLTAH